MKMQVVIVMYVLRTDLGTYFVKGLGSECKFNLGHKAGATAWEEHFKWKKSIYFLLQNVINHTI